ncbi:Abi-alpha family protein [Acidisoma cladoniae]|uniref:Abi-alpha family protein n=1 Tax=Acidisoma cladoniae TaxID=3040935 RepID=UPI00254B0C0E|nr:Abi-alpha family protein [Acidisoma sp. PAMC 29798]
MSVDDGAASAVTIMPVTPEQAEAVKAAAEFGTTVVTEGSNFVRYMGAIIGTVPNDLVGIVLGDPLRAAREAIAAKLYGQSGAIIERRGAKTEPVSPSVAIPLIRAAYDESRPELQRVWAELIAAAMDPTRADRVRVRFIETVKGFDPLDALLLRERHLSSGGFEPNAIDYFANRLRRNGDQITVSVENLARLGCVDANPMNARKEFSLTAYGRELIRACSD